MKTIFTLDGLTIFDVVEISAYLLSYLFGGSFETCNFEETGAKLKPASK